MTVGVSRLPTWANLALAGTQAIVSAAKWAIRAKLG